MATRARRLVMIIAIVLGILAVGFVATLIAIAPAYLD
jgi:capsular polysaccharide biosynthesis protein